MNQFNPEQYIPQLSIDSVIFGYRKKQLHVLISKMNFGHNIYTLPGGFISQDQGIDEAALQILKERTGLKDIFLEQYKTFGPADRKNNPILDVLDQDKPTPMPDEQAAVEWFSKRFISIGYYALVDINKVKPQKTDLDESVDWLPIESLPSLIMDHNQMVQEALETLRRNLDEKLIGFNLLPETFTMRELQELYEAVYDKAFARNNFQKKMLSLEVLERLEKKFTGAANKAPYLYRFRR
ncbi:NUDIX hydrolase [Jiulongibacter sediminis]|uniref:NUDIX hydrolase n=1 Tax=Jiulongibacter sediminis TaxID=1605367 RepID=A0A0P7BYV0_9BACT|nr:NUDIX domain-containing protein [Jiulongibacter sediminis]KPM46750.1 NUDIX hydrolase [Jiulongibacter sediminis]TBX21656.1 NUDIX hydrolase [Jiulongibacter sediminis]